MGEKMNNNLFKKLNEQMEINSIKSAPMLESEVKEAETRVIFNDYIKELRENTIMAVDSSFLNEDALFEDFREFLDEEGFDLNEEVLTEGKNLNKLRWKLAKYALKFLKEETIDEIIKGYYGEEKAKEKLSLKKKEKVKIVREIADKLPDEKKDQVANNEAARKLERSGILSAAGGIAVAGIAGAGAVVTNNALQNANAAKKEVISAQGDSTHITRLNKKVDSAATDTSAKLSKLTGVHSAPGDDPFRYVGNIDVLSRNSALALRSASALLSTVASFLGGAIIGSIVAGAIGLVSGSVRAGIKFHQANVMRANEIMQYLLSKKSEEKQLKE